MIAFPNSKINIGLNIVEKRADDFHNIESVFFPVFDWCDILEIVKVDGLNSVNFRSTGIDIPGNSNDNLCIKAFNLLKDDYGIDYVKIHLHKCIPIGAGLGGGSADAAFTLRLLNDLFELNLSQSENRLTDLIQLPVSEWKDCIVNDFEASIFPIHKSIRSLKADMYEKGAIYASMSGSGSAVYGIFEQ